MPPRLRPMVFGLIRYCSFEPWDYRACGYCNRCSDPHGDHPTASETRCTGRSGPTKYTDTGDESHNVPHLGPAQPRARTRPPDAGPNRCGLRGGGPCPLKPGNHSPGRHRSMSAERGAALSLAAVATAAVPLVALGCGQGATSFDKSKPHNPMQAH